MHTITVDRLDPPIPSNVTAILCVRDDESACRRGSWARHGRARPRRRWRARGDRRRTGGRRRTSARERAQCAGRYYGCGLAAAGRRPSRSRRCTALARGSTGSHCALPPGLRPRRAVARCSAPPAPAVCGQPGGSAAPAGGRQRQAWRRTLLHACRARLLLAQCNRCALSLASPPGIPPPQLTHRSVCASVCRAAASTAASILFCSWDPGAACAYCSPCNRRT